MNKRHREKRVPEQSELACRAFVTALMDGVNTPDQKFLVLGHAYIVCARIHGLLNWNTLLARIATPPLSWEKAVPAMNAALRQFGAPALNAERAAPLLSILSIYGDPAALPAEEEDLPWPLEVRPAPRTFTRSASRASARSDRDDEDFTEEQLRLLRVWTPSIPPKPTRPERELNALARQAANARPPEPPRDVKYTLTRNVVLRQYEPTDWYNHGKLIDRIRHEIACGALEFCLPGLKAELIEEYGPESVELMYGPDTGDVTYEIDTRLVLRAIFNRDPGGLLVHYHAASSHKAVPDTTLWSFGHSSAQARNSALRKLALDWQASRAAQLN